jgi:hypothetical protein
MRLVKKLRWSFWGLWKKKNTDWMYAPGQQQTLTLKQKSDWEL